MMLAIASEVVTSNSKHQRRDQLPKNICGPFSGMVTLSPAKPSDDLKIHQQKFKVVSVS